MQTHTSSLFRSLPCNVGLSRSWPMGLRPMRNDTVDLEDMSTWSLRCYVTFRGSLSLASFLLQSRPIVFKRCSLKVSVIVLRCILPIGILNDFEQRLPKLNRVLSCLPRASRAPPPGQMACLGGGGGGGGDPLLRQPAGILHPPRRYTDKKCVLGYSNINWRRREVLEYVPIIRIMSYR